MKKQRHMFRICIILVAVLLGIGFLGGIARNYIPQKYRVYLNGELVEDIYAHEYDGHIYLPVLGTMKLYGYEVNCAEGHDPEFVIDEVTYHLNIKECEIYDGKNSYLGVTSGQSFLHLSEYEVYAYVDELDFFFTCIGKEPVAIANTDWRAKCVYFEL